MSETLTPAEKELLAKTISEALSGRISLNITDVMKLVSAAKKIGSSREHVVQGLRDWIRTDPQAQELLAQAVAGIGAKIFTQPQEEPDVG